MTTADKVKDLVDSGSLRQSLEKKYYPPRTISAICRKATDQKPLRGIILVESGDLRNDLLHSGWTSEMIDLLIHRY